ncbi:MAG: DUF1963 domain-containing protein [Pikeienuella sp.]
MFDSLADAAEALLAYFNQPQVEIFVEALIPTVTFTLTEAEYAPGGTRIGGAPDAPAGFDWPHPEIPANLEEIISRANEDAGREMRQHIMARTPYAFIAQINLAEAARLGPVAAPLPQDGRLLFFYDLATGPWDTGTRTAKVIWDRTPVDALHPLTPPSDLLAAAAREKERNAALNAEYGLEPEIEGAGTSYGGPARAMKLTTTLRLPEIYAVEIDAFPDIAAAARQETDDAAKQELFSDYMNALEGIDLKRASEEETGHQLLGSPYPEQDDPRYDAVAVTEWGRQYLSSEEWTARRDEMFTKARDWALLLQVEIGDWMQERFAEGKIYFLIHRDDLAARRFERVVAVYQQT